MIEYKTYLTACRFNHLINYFQLTHNLINFHVFNKIWNQNTILNVSKRKLQIFE